MEAGYSALKRSIDVLGAGLGLLVLAPVMLVVALAVLLRMGRPVLFRQLRPGLHGVPFVIYKFRTMTDGGGPDARRLTPLGRLLRRTSLDELPELVNVLRGEMSLVGPRPLLGEYLDRYTPRQARRHEVRPGITGWAQVGGRNALSWEERLERDVHYVDQASLTLDLAILVRTMGCVLRQEGIAAAGYATMPRLGGSAAPGPAAQGSPPPGDA